MGHLRFFARYLVPALFTTLTPSFALAQATAVATKALEIEVFGGGGVVRPDYGNSPDASLDHSFLLGGDITLPLRILPVVPGLEIRANIASGSAINEKSYQVGLKLQREFGHVRPYVDGLYGLGTLHFNYPNGGYTGDRSAVYTAGGGVDIALFRNFMVKFDAQYNEWNLGQGPGVTSAVKLHPLGASGGIVYTIPFHGARGQPRDGYIAP